MRSQEKQRKLGEQKVVQYLNEAHAMELALVQTLTAHIAITPRPPPPLAVPPRTRTPPPPDPPPRRADRAAAGPAGPGPQPLPGRFGLCPGDDRAEDLDGQGTGRHDPRRRAR